jgi:hypothetical protein
MSHFFTIVLLRAEQVKESGVEAQVKKLMAPYSNARRVELHKAYLDETDLEVLRRMWPGTDNDEQIVEAIKSYVGKPGAKDMEGFYYWTQANPKGRWDWWQIGGEWNGAVRANRPKMLDKAATAAKEAEMRAKGDSEYIIKLTATVAIPNPHYDPVLAKDMPANNTCPVKDLPEDIIAFALLTPEGEWHEQGEVGMWGVALNEKPDWPETFLKLLGNYSDCLAVGVDCHQ